MREEGGRPGRIREAEQILRANDRGTYTQPTARLYPFQWNWDSALVAMGWATFDEPRAWRELGTLLAGQWDDGLVPHILFHAPSADYFPGPEAWGLTTRRPPSSGITQPPVLATAVGWILDHAKARADAEAEAAQLYPRLIASHRWWARARDPGNTGLVATLHPWETGMDNSPAWDRALARVPATTATPIVRRDTAHVDAAMRPSEADYARYIHLVELFRGVDWNPAAMFRDSPFRIADLGTNAILLRAERDLLRLARRFGSPVERSEIEARIARQITALECLWSAPDRSYFSRDLISERPIPVRTSAGLLAVFAAEQRHAADLATTLASWQEAVAWPVPSTAPTSPSFEPKRYWRGPVWPCVNWMLADGFASIGDAPNATTLADATLDLIARSGFFEYFDPRDGCGLGGDNFSWTAAVFLLFSRSGTVPYVE